MTDPVREVEAEQRVEELQSANLRLLRQLDKIKTSREELVAAVYRAVDDNLKSLHFMPTPRPIRERRKGDEETAVIVFSDLQLGQVTPTYNSEIAEERVLRYLGKIKRLIELQRAAHPVRKAKLYLLGDLIEGELIFPGQPHQIDASLFNQVAETGPRILVDFIRGLLSFLDYVEVVSVPGNHGDVGGASRKSYNPETNFDRMLTKFVQTIFEASGEKRVSFRIPSGFGRSSFYAVDWVGDVGFMLWHGHQAKRTSNSSHLPFYKLVMGWRSGSIPEPFTVSICGHHHVPTMLPMNSVMHYINGTFASDADYAVERFASNVRAAQWLLFARAGKGVTAQYLVNLDD